MTEVVLTDASVIIDLFHINLLRDALTLSYDFCTTDFIVAEITEEQQSKLLNKIIGTGSLKIIEANAEDLEEITQIFNSIGKLSFADSSLIYFASKLHTIIITGDNRMKKEAVDRNIGVHGILWIFEKLIEKGIITQSIAAGKLKELMRINKYLPKSACERLIEKWTG